MKNWVEKVGSDFFLVNFNPNDHVPLEYFPQCTAQRG